MFRPQEAWVHAAMLDCCLAIRHVQYNALEYCKVRATFKNRFNGLDYETKTYTIKRKDFRNWKRLESK